MSNMPIGWRVSTESHGGSGRGDELYSPHVYQWQGRLVRTGILKLRLEKQYGWVLAAYFPFKDEEFARQWVLDTVMVMEVKNNV